MRRKIDIVTKYPNKPTFAPPYHTLVPIEPGRYIKVCQSVAQVACPDCGSAIGEACTNAESSYIPETCNGRDKDAGEDKLSARRSLARLAHKIANWLERPESHPYPPVTIKREIDRLLVPLQRYIDKDTIWPEDRDVIETDSWKTQYCAARANCPNCYKHEAWFLPYYGSEDGLGEIILEMDNPPACPSCGLTGKKLVLTPRKMQVGNYYDTVVFAVAPFGIFVRHSDHPTVDILIKVTEVSWGLEMSTSERAKVGDKLSIRITHIANETSVQATIVGEEIDEDYKICICGHDAMQHRDLVGDSSGCWDCRNNGALCDKFRSVASLKYLQTTSRELKVAAIAEKAFGDRDKATSWLNKPNQALGGKIPLALLDTDEGAKQVTDLLGRIDTGTFS